MERKKNEEIKGRISSSSLILVYMIHLPTVHVCTNFQSSRPHSSWEKIDEKFQCWKLERKKNEEMKEWISSSSLIPVYMIHLHTVHMCTKFQSSRPHNSRVKVTKNFNVKNWRERKMNLLGLTVPEKSVTKNSNIWKVNLTWRFHNMSIENLIHPQGHVSDWFDPARIRTCLRFYGCPGYQQVWRRSVKNERASLETPFSHY